MRLCFIMRGKRYPNEKNATAYIFKQAKRATINLRRGNNKGIQKKNGNRLKSIISIEKLRA